MITVVTSESSSAFGVFSGTCSEASSRTNPITSSSTGIKLARRSGLVRLATQSSIAAANSGPECWLQIRSSVAPSRLRP